MNSRVKASLGEISIRFIAGMKKYFYIAVCDRTPFTTGIQTGSAWYPLQGRTYSCILWDLRTAAPRKTCRLITLMLKCTEAKGLAVCREINALGTAASLSV